MFSTAQPIVDDVSKLAAAGSGLPGVGPVAAGAAILLDVVAKLKVTSIPPGNGYEWHAEKVVRHVEGKGLMHGIKWSIPKKLFSEFGSRLTGSIALSIIPAQLQHATNGHQNPQFNRMPIRAEAVMYLGPQKKPRPFSLPGEGEFLELEIEPQVELVSAEPAAPRAGTTRG